MKEVIYGSIITAQGWDWTHSDRSALYFFFFLYMCWARWTEAGSSRVTCTARKTAVPPAVLSQYSSSATHVVGYKGQLGASNKSEDCHKIRLFISISMQCVFSASCVESTLCEGWGFRFTQKQISVCACHLHNHSGDSLRGSKAQCFTLACDQMYISITTSTLWPQHILQGSHTFWPLSQDIFGHLRILDTIKNQTDLWVNLTYSSEKKKNLLKSFTLSKNNI